MEKTDWFSASVNPVYPGLYETTRGNVVRSCEGVHMLQWTGYNWIYPYAQGHAETGTPAAMVPSDGDVWRGLAHKP